MSVDHLPPVERTEVLRPPPTERQPRVRPITSAKEDRWEPSRDDADKEQPGTEQEDQPPEEAAQETGHFDQRA